MKKVMDSVRSIRSARNLIKMAASSCETDPLEYYIKLPNPNKNYSDVANERKANNGNNGTGESDFVFVVEDEEANKTPVILLFGWAGCQDKYLAKYSEMYEQKGLITLRYIAPVKCLFYKRYQMVSIGEKLVKLLVDLNFDAHPILVHCFSNGGAYLYQNFSHALGTISSTLKQPVQIKGVIFDSAPGKRRIHSLYQAIAQIVGGGKLYNIAMSSLLTMFVSMIWMYDVIANIWKHPEPYQTNPLETLLDEMYKWPQHFIYSKTDTLIPPHDIEYFMNCRKIQGVQVSSLCFEDSPHVYHYQGANKEVYARSVFEFLNRCLNGNIHDDHDDTVKNM